MVNFVSLFYSHYTAVSFEDGVKDICTHSILGSWVISYVNVDLKEKHFMEAQKALNHHILLINDSTGNHTRH
jgi:hypothetical protein